MWIFQLSHTTHSEWRIMMMAMVCDCMQTLCFRMYCTTVRKAGSSKTRYVNRISLVSLFWLAHYAKIALVWSFADKLAQAHNIPPTSSFETVRLHNINCDVFHISKIIQIQTNDTQNILYTNVCYSVGLGCVGLEWYADKWGKRNIWHVIITAACTVIPFKLFYIHLCIAWTKSKLLLCIHHHH